MINLDRIDRLILHELDCNGRASLLSIAKKLKLGIDVVNYRVEKFFQEETIKSVVPTIDFNLLGYTVFKSYLRLNPKQGRIKELLQYCKQLPERYWLAELHGHWDLVISVFAENPIKFREIQDRLLAKFDDTILEMSVCIAVESYLFPRSYLVGKSSDEKLSTQSEQSYHLDETERSILKLLFSNARMPYTEIAARLNSTPAIVKYRVEKLESAKVITGYRTEPNHQQLGILCFKILVQAGAEALSLQKSFLTYCKKHPNISCFSRQLGAWTLEFEAEVESIEQFHTLIDELRFKFGDYIRSLQSHIIRKDYGHSFS
jgi:Lrp/AsnC family leucine-responsive transcriptional regulator